MRNPIVAGQFYPASKKALIESIEYSFRMGYGTKIQTPPEPADAGGEERFLGVVSPHAGYSCSGPTASYSFAYLLEHGFPDIIVVLGPLHYPVPEKVYLSQEDFATPLGVVKNDTKLGERLASGRSPIDISDRAHVHEHSLEVQLPFLQYLAPKPFSIVPIAFARQDLKTARNVGKHIASVLRDYGQEHDKTVGVVASSDFCHVGSNYRYTPIVGTGETIVSWMEKHDGKAMESIVQLDTDGFSSYKKELGLTICGASPIMTLMEIAKEMGVPKGEFLHYETSYKVSKSIHAIVGYGAIGFKTP